MEFVEVISMGKLNTKLWTTRWVWLYCGQRSYFQCFSESEHTLLVCWLLLSSRKNSVISIHSQLSCLFTWVSMNSSWGTSKWNKIYGKQLTKSRDYQKQFLKLLTFEMWFALQTCTEKVSTFNQKFALLSCKSFIYGSHHYTHLIIITLFLWIQTRWDCKQGFNKWVTCKYLDFSKD